MTASNSDTRSILIQLADGSYRRVSNIPKNSKVTYAKATPGAEGQVNTREVPWCVRIYATGQTGANANQLAVFTGVKEFRDLSLTVERQIIEPPTIDPLTRQVMGPAREPRWEREEV